MGSKRREVVNGEVACSNCKVYKPFTDYFKAKNKGLGIESSCKLCAMRKKRDKRPVKIIITEKLCISCDIIKPVEDFAKWRNICSKCKTIENRSRDNYEINWRKGNERKSKLLEESVKLKVALTLKELLDTKIEEIWRDIPHFEGKYQASDLGRIRCLPYVFRNDKNALITNLKSYIVKDSERKGYRQTPLTDFNGKVHYKGTHRWVMYAFYGELDLQVDHINGIRDDNRLVNLRYCTARENNNYKKDNIPEFFTSSLYGVYKQGKGWASYIKINGIDYYLGNYNRESDAHDTYMKAWKDWDNFQKLPEKFINPNKTSQYKGVDFHNASGKWRVRMLESKIYIGIFETEALAIRVYKLLEYMINKGIIVDKQLVLKIRKKYTVDNRLRPLININTNEIYYSLKDASDAIGMNCSTLNSKLNKNLNNDTIIRYL